MCVAVLIYMCMFKFIQVYVRVYTHVRLQHECVLSTRLRINTEVICEQCCRYMYLWRSLVHYIPASTHVLPKPSTVNVHVTEINAIRTYPQ